MELAQTEKSTFFEALALRFLVNMPKQLSSAPSWQPTRRMYATIWPKLNGARFVTAVESDSGKRLDETLVKQMTGWGYSHCSVPLL